MAPYNVDNFCRDDDHDFQDDDQNDHDYHHDDHDNHDDVHDYFFMMMIRMKKLDFLWVWKGHKSAIKN